MLFLLRLVYRIFKYTLYAVLLLTLIFALWWLTYRIYRHKICAELPNGLLIGRMALFDPKDTYWTPDVTLKLADGTSLIKDHVFLFYFSDSTAYGVAGRYYHPEEDYGFAYRPDIGFALSTENPEKYKRIMKEAGPPVAGADVLGYPINSNLLNAYLKLIESPKYRREYCPLSIYP